jgi:hypothetical protein
MSNAYRYPVVVVALALAAVAADAYAQRAGGIGDEPRGDSAASTIQAALTPKQRGGLTRQFVTKWGGYMQRLYGVPVKVWAMRMVPTFVTVDPSNFRRALARDTFEGALSELKGVGHRLDDARVIDRLARGKTGSAATQAWIAAKVLGEVSRDLVYTPIVPCRIVDTRLTPAGRIESQSTRDFIAINQPDYSAQGGSATDCGTLGLQATAIALNATAVLPAEAGYATLYSYGSPRPLASSLNYRIGFSINSGLIVRIPNPQSAADFTIYTYAPADYVVDIVGYFAPPEATPLGCTSTFVTQNVAANGLFDTQIPSCPTGYTVTGAGCRTQGFNEVSWSINGLYRSGGNIATLCSGQNLTTGTITIEGTAQCCRVPGR